MDTTKYPPLLCSQNTTLNCYAHLWNKIQCKKMEPLLLLAARYLTLLDTHLWVAFDFLNPQLR